MAVGLLRRSAPFGRATHSGVAAYAQRPTIRDEEESRWLRRVRVYLEAHLGRIVDHAGRIMGMPSDLFWGHEQELATIVLRDLLGNTANRGGLFAMGELQRRYRVGVDWGLVNTSAQKWATEFAGQLATGITETTRGQVGQVIGDWIASGEPMPQLATRLREQAGIQRRAEMIASTETTRAFTEGNRIAWAESGVVEREGWETADDERVCPICFPLSGKQNQKIGEDFPGGYRPPAHVACRCWAVPIVRGTR